MEVLQSEIHRFFSIPRKWTAFFFSLFFFNCTWAHIHVAGDAVGLREEILLLNLCLPIPSQEVVLKRLITKAACLLASTSYSTMDTRCMEVTKQ